MNGENILAIVSLVVAVIALAAGRIYVFLETGKFTKTNRR